MRRYLFVSLFCLVIPITLSAQAPDTIRVCTYNLLQLGGDDGDRAEDMLKVLSEISPSILIVQEILNLEGWAVFVDSVRSRLPVPLVGNFSFVLGEDSNVSIHFDTAKVKFYTRIGLKAKESPRTHPYFGLIVKSTSDTINILAGHLKAGDSPEDETTRWRETRYYKQILDEQFRRNLIYAADFNVYTSNEHVYRTLMSVDSNRPWRLYDPIDRPGDWHNNPEFADIHTQSPRARQFGGGVHGGMDDRFDQILISEELLDNVRPETYTAFGNDGQHFNDSINAMPNTAVSAEMAQALHDASDHLPVYVDFVFGLTTDVRETPVPDELDLTATPSPAVKEEETR